MVLKSHGPQNCGFHPNKNEKNNNILEILRS